MRIKPIGKNMVELNVDDKRVLFSYETPVACHIPGKGFFKTAEFFSTTTSRHIDKWLRWSGAGYAMRKPQSFFENLIGTGAKK
jgi:hypothetical protein